MSNKLGDKIEGLTLIEAGKVVREWHIETLAEAKEVIDFYESDKDKTIVEYYNELTNLMKVYAGVIRLKESVDTKENVESLKYSMEIWERTQQQIETAYAMLHGDIRGQGGVPQ